MLGFWLNLLVFVVILDCFGALLLGFLGFWNMFVEGMAEIMNLGIKEMCILG